MSSQGLDLESKGILKFVAAVDDSCGVHQSALVWADMIAVTSAHVACLGHQLQLTTMEFWRADIQHVLEGERNFTGSCIAFDNSDIHAAQLSHACASMDEKHRALQQWLYDSHNEDAFLSDHMTSEQRSLEYAAQELGTVKTVGMCRRQAGNRSEGRVEFSTSLLEAQWLCQCALVQQHQSALQERERLLIQGKDLRELCPWIEDEPDIRESRDMCIEDLRSAVVSVSL